MNIKCLLFYLTVFMIVILYPFRINAETCNSAELNSLRAQANAAEIKYYYIKDFSVPDDSHLIGLPNIYNLFNISLNNLTDSIYAIVDKTNFIYTYNGVAEVPNVAIRGPFSGGQTYTFNFYAHTNDTCNGQLLTTKIVKLPSYNHYSKHELCKGAEEYELCNMWYEGNISLEKFIERVTEYKKNKEKEIKGSDLLPKNRWDIIMDWIINYYNIILLSIIITGTIVIIVLKINEKRKSVL